MDEDGWMRMEGRIWVEDEGWMERGRWMKSGGGILDGSTSSKWEVWYAHAFGDCFRPVGKRSWAMADGEDLKEWARQYDVELRRVLRGEENLLAEEVPGGRVL